MKLPHAEHAFVDIAKLREYCLNPRHPRGRHKARVFAAALGFGAEDAGLFSSILLRAVLESSAVPTEKDEHGQRYIVDFPMAGPKGQALVRSSWIVLDGENFPRFLTCYVL
jgi:hypothetical protein